MAIYFGGGTSYTAHGWTGSDDRDFDAEDPCQLCGRLFFRPDLTDEGVCASCVDADNARKLEEQE